MNIVGVVFHLAFNLKCSVYMGSDVWKMFLFLFVFWFLPNPVSLAMLYYVWSSLYHNLLFFSSCRTTAVSISNVFLILVKKSLNHYPLFWQISALYLLQYNHAAGVCAHRALSAGHPPSLALNGFCTLRPPVFSCCWIPWTCFFLIYPPVSSGSCCPSEPSPFFCKLFLFGPLLLFFLLSFGKLFLSLPFFLSNRYLMLRLLTAWSLSCFFSVTYKRSSGHFTFTHWHSLSFLLLCLLIHSSNCIPTSLHRCHKGTSETVSQTLSPYQTSQMWYSFIFSYIRKWNKYKCNCASHLLGTNSEHLLLSHFMTNLCPSCINFMYNTIGFLYLSMLLFPSLDTSTIYLSRLVQESLNWSFLNWVLLAFNMFNKHHQVWYFYNKNRLYKLCKLFNGK